MDENENKTSIAKIIEDKGNFTVFRVNQPYTQLFIQPSVEQWLRGFYDAKFVVTDSFHACVFSILFNKPFIVVGNENRGLSRFKSLLKMTKQEFRLISETTTVDLSDELLKAPDVDLSLLRNLSINFIKSSLG